MKFAPALIGTKDGLLDVPVKYAGGMPLAGVLVRVAGTAQAGNTVVLGDLGTFRIEFNGEPTINADSTTLIHLSDAGGYTLEATSALGAAYAFDLIIPFRNFLDSYDTNAVHEDFILYHGGMNLVNVLTANVRFLGMVCADAPLYRPGLHRYGDFVQDTRYRIEEPNSIYLYLRTPAHTIAKVYVERDGRVFCNSNLAELIDLTEWQCNFVGVPGASLIPFQSGPNQVFRPSSAMFMDLAGGTAADPLVYAVFFAARLYPGGQGSPLKVASVMNPNTFSVARRGVTMSPTASAAAVSNTL